MSYVHSFPPIESATSRVLILGTMPGIVSLRECQYYAHPQNAFWRILGSILGFDPAISYPDRVALVRSADLAIWDVLRSCTRKSSLDSDIDPASAVPNDLPAFLDEHPQIRRICFNGAKAQALYARHVQPRLADGPDVQEIQYVRLPSTSPANASLPWPEKVRTWQAIVL